MTLLKWPFILCTYIRRIGVRTRRKTINAKLMEWEKMWERTPENRSVPEIVNYNLNGLEFETRLVFGMLSMDLVLVSHSGAPPCWLKIQNRHEKSPPLFKIENVWPPTLAIVRDIVSVAVNEQATHKFTIFCAHSAGRVVRIAFTQVKNKSVFNGFRDNGSAKNEKQKKKGKEKNSGRKEKSRCYAFVLAFLALFFSAFEWFRPRKLLCLALERFGAFVQPLLIVIMQKNVKRNPI